jgi:hypothetical protein
MLQDIVRFPGIRHCATQRTYTVRALKAELVAVCGQSEAYRLGRAVQ